MTKAEKTRDAIAAHSGNIRFDTLHAYLVNQIGCSHRASGSHNIYTLPNGKPISITKPHGNTKTVKRFYIRNLDALLTEESL